MDINFFEKATGSVTDTTKENTGCDKQKESTANIEPDTDYLTYMTSADLEQLRKAHAEVGISSARTDSEERSGRGSARSKRSRGGGAVGYSYSDDLVEEDQKSLRGRITDKKQRQYEDMDEEIREGEDELTTVHRMREEALDSQYEESESKLWAAIPEGSHHLIMSFYFSQQHTVYDY